MNAAKGGEVDVDIRDKREEAYVKPKPKVIAFSGEGRKLGRSANKQTDKYSYKQTD